MKKLLFLVVAIAIAIIISSYPANAAQKIRPDQINTSIAFPAFTMTSGANITFDGGYIVGATGMGDVIGPSSATDGFLPLWDGVTGKLLKNSIYSPSSFSASGHVHTGTYEPADANIQTHIANVTNPHGVTAAQAGAAATAHNHAGSDINSGTLDGDRLPAMSTTKKGGVPATGTVTNAEFLCDNGSWITPAGSGDVTGPSSSVDSNFAGFNGVTGKIIKDSGSKASDFAAASHNQAASTITSDTLDGDRLPAMSTTKKGAVPATSTVTGTEFLCDNGSWIVPPGGDAVTDHGDLTGLTDDDHTNYLLAAGTRGLSADWDAGSHEVRAQTLESDVATGTAPMTITSTTKVTNLNADQLDGAGASTTSSAGIIPIADGSGDIASTFIPDISATYVPKSLLTEQGDLAYRDGSGWQTLHHGTSGQYLATGGHGANPSWDTPEGSGTYNVTVTVGPYAWCDYVTDGTNDYVQVQAANDYLASIDGGTITSMGDIYMGTSDVTLDSYVNLVGMNDPMADYLTGQVLADNQMSRIIVTKTTGTGAITVNSVNAIQNIQFWYSGQVTNGTPTVYPPTIHLASNSQHVLIERVNFGNSYYCIDATDSHNSLQCFEVAASPISRFAAVGNSYGGDYFDKCDVWPLYTFATPGSTYLSWIQENLTVLEVNRSDGMRIRNFNVYGANEGFVFHGTSRPEIYDCQFDAVLSPIKSDSDALEIHVDRCLFDSYRFVGTPVNQSDTYAVELISGGHHIIENCDVIRAGGGGIHVFGGDSRICNNNMYNLALSETSVSRGIVFGGSNSVINGNSIDAGSRTGSQGIYIGGDHNSVSMNAISRIANSAIELASGSNNNTIIGNNCMTTGGLADSSGESNTIELNDWD